MVIFFILFANSKEHLILYENKKCKSQGIKCTNLESLKAGKRFRETTGLKGTSFLCILMMKLKENLYKIPDQCYVQTRDTKTVLLGVSYNLIM